MAGFSLEERDEDEAIAVINVIPFVDIVLVLLIIFLLTSNIIAKGVIPVDLPRAANAGATVDPTVNIVLTSTGDLYVEGEAMTRQAMRDRVGERFKAEPRLRAVIAADKAVRYEYVVEVIDLLKEIGIGAFALDIEKTSGR
jgi:biopolymer transport protein ExbD